MCKTNFLMTGNVQKVQRQLNNGVDVNIKNGDGLSLLYAAVENGNINHSYDLST